MTTHASDDLYDRVHAAAAVVRARLGGRTPAVGLILGSGLGGFADRLADPVRIDYGELPGFPVSKVHGHAGRLVIGERGGATCVAMQGRVHLYEGHRAVDVAFPARVLVALGAKVLIVTNAAGGLNPSVAAGHADADPRPPRLPARSPAAWTQRRAPRPALPRHDHRLRARAARAGQARSRPAQGVDARRGRLRGDAGPVLRDAGRGASMLQIVGGDATGMSTVPEVIVARHMGARVIGISCITNQAAGITGAALSHDEVTETAARVRATFEGLLDGILAALVGGGHLEAA
jgi:purine-nucleoside phosphorylase